MKHQDCMTTLLRSGAGEDQREAAREHVARCPDCWAVLAVLHELATGGAPADADRMTTLFACEPVRDQLYLLAGLDAATLRAHHPAAARHLGWCVACRERFAEVAAVEALATRGEIDPVLAPSTRWRDVVESAGERVREAVGRVVVRVQRAVAAVTAVPDGFVLVPGVAVAGAVRGAPATSALPPGAGQQVSFALEETGLWAEFRVEPEAGQRFSLVLDVLGERRPRLTIALRELHGERTQLIARQAMADDQPVVVKGLGPGRYVLDLHERAPAERRFRLRFDVEPAD